MTDTSALYITEAEFRSYISDDSTLEAAAVNAAITAACRKIDAHCGRWFNQRSEVRYYSPDATTNWPFWFLEVDDIATTTALAVASQESNAGNYNVSWTIDTDFICEPVNRSRDGISPWPYTCLHAIGDRIFPIKYTPTRRETVRVTAAFGWPTAPPDDVKQATKIVAAQLWKLGSAPFGVAGFNEFGSVRVRDIPAAADILLPYRRAGGVGIA